MNKLRDHDWTTMDAWLPLLTVKSSSKVHYSKRFHAFVLLCAVGLSGCSREKAVYRAWARHESVSGVGLHRPLLKTSLDQPGPEHTARAPVLIRVDSLQKAMLEAERLQKSDRETAVFEYRAVALMAEAAMAQPGDAGTEAALAEIHRKSLIRCLHLVGADKAKSPEELANCLGQVNLQLQLNEQNWAGLTFTKIVPSSDYEIRNIEPIVMRDGWGLPVLADRTYGKDEIRPDREKFFATDNRVTATARIRSQISSAGQNLDWKTVPAELVLHNPLDEVHVALAHGGSSPLAADFTTPSLVQFSQSGLQGLEYEGLLIPDLVAQQSGVYLNEPYRPGKIPVLFVHGLWSSPRTWTDMNNSLLADPDVRSNYQFMFALYPTGDPVLGSAAMIRKKIVEIRQTFDPEKKDAAWDQMVVVCHSMGGIVSRLLVTASGDHFEKAMFTKPLDQLEMSAEVREEFRNRLHFEPVPEVRRAVFLAPVFRGSSFASNPVGRLSSMLVRSSDDLRQYRSEIVLNNGPGVVQPKFRSIRLTNGIDNLQPSNPILKALDQTHPAAGVSCHVVLGDNQKLIPRLRGEMTDGLVTYSSGHLNGAESELIIAANHYLNHDQPAIAEVQRVLRLHIGLGPQELQVLASSEHATKR